MPTLVVRHPDGTETEHELSASLTIGRADGNDLVLSQGGVSRKHATVSSEGGAIFVEDHGSANGTFVDGEKIAAKTKLSPRAQVVVGDYELSIKAGPAAAKKPAGASGSKPVPRGPGGNAATSAQPAVKPARATKVVASIKPSPDGAAAIAKRGPSAPASKTAQAAGAHLKGITGPWANKIFPIRGKVTVGRVAGVQIVVEDDSVSRRHAEVEKTPNGIVVRDLGSANGTMVNGSPLGQGDEIALQTGDVVQFGVIEFAFDGGDAEVLNAPTRRGGGGRAAAGGGGGAGGGGAGGSRKKLFIIGGAAAALLLVGVGIAAMNKPDPEQIVDNGGGGAELPPDPTLEIENKVSECRTYSSPDIAGQDPDWERAEKACQWVLEQEPIHPEATSLLRKIKVEKEAFGYYKAAEKLLRTQRDEEALDQYAKIPEDSAYFRKVRQKVNETVDSVKKRTSEDCLNQVKSRFYSSALPRCEKWMTIACCSMPADQLAPPPGYKIVLDGKLPKDGWRPNDKTHIAYLRAKQESAPDSAPFECPNTRMFCAIEDGPKVTPKSEVEAYFKTRYTDKQILFALMAYWDGRDAEATVQLMKLREDRTKASLHPVVDTLRADISSVAQLFKQGESRLNVDKKAMEADEPFKEALAIDGRLMQEMTEKRPSFFRRNINSDMAAAAYTAGKDWADKKDRKKACAFWKTGFSYSKVNPDLLKAIGACSEWASVTVKEAGGCEDLDFALALAVEGDGIKAKVDAKKAELQCP